MPRPPRSHRPIAAALVGVSAMAEAAAVVAGYLGALTVTEGLGALLGATTLMQLGALVLMLRAPRAERRGERVGRYELCECLGSGGMGEVWRALDLTHRREVAVKILRAHRAQRLAVRRFEREICLTRNLMHPNTVEVYDFGVTKAGDHFYSMELLEGESLGTLLGRTGPLPWQRAMAFLRSVADTLAEAHAQGVVHRDLKPDNLFVTLQDGSRDQLKLLDFGVATVPGEAEPEPLTRDDCVAGTPAYVAPEVAAGGTASPASDIYALGVVMYRMLTGRLPFALQSSDALSQLFIHATLPSVPLSQRVTLPAPLEAVVMRCLHKDPADRYADARALGDALDALSAPADEPEEAEASGVRMAREPVTSPTPLFGHTRAPLGKP